MPERLLAAGGAGRSATTRSAWRFSTTGLELIGHDAAGGVTMGDTSVAEQAVLNALAGTLDVGIPYPFPTSNSMPVQESTPARPDVP